METDEIRAALHKKIDQGDERLLQKLFAVIEQYNPQEDDIEMARRILIAEERNKYLSGEQRSYTWDEVKSMALNKQKPIDVHR
jgi:hypothetical protein